MAREISATWLRARMAAAVFGLAAIAAACGGVADENVSASALPEPVLVGEFETLDNGTIDLAALEGQDVVFWFWAPW